MDNVNIKVLTAILNGKMKTDKSYQEYLRVKDINKNKFDLSFQTEINDKYERFQINLYNYARSIVDKKKMFTNFKELQNVFDTKIVITSWKNCEKKEYEFSELYRCFRNRKEHFDKINYEEEYILFKNNVSFELLEKLYNTCNKVLNIELEKLNQNELVSILLGNVDVKASFEKMITNMIITNEKNKNQYPEIYILNNEILSIFKTINFDDITLDQIDNIYFSIEKYLLDETYKNIFIENYGFKIYDDFIKLCNSEDFNTIEEDMIKISNILNEIYEIEQKKKES